MKTAEELGTGPGGWETLWSPRGGAAGGEEGGNGLDGGLSMKMGRKAFKMENKPQSSRRRRWGSSGRCWVYGTSFQPVTDVTRGAAQEGLGRGQTC